MLRFPRLLILSVIAGTLATWPAPPLGGALETGRTLNYIEAGNENRRMSSLFLSLMDRMGVKLDQFGDGVTRL